jgi:peptidoglycan/LPS O-acetylase OafA/YrhL
LTHGYATHLRIDSLLFGVLLSYWHWFRPERLAFVRHRPRVVLAASAGLLAPAFLFSFEHPFTNTAGFTLAYAAFGGVLLLALNWRPKPTRGCAAVLSFAAFLGSHSYSIYLWHMPMRLWLLPRIERMLGQRPPYAVELLVYLSGSLFLGVVMAKVVEFPALWLRDRCFPSRSGRRHPQAPPRSEDAILVKQEGH